MRIHHPSIWLLGIVPRSTELGCREYPNYGQPSAYDVLITQYVYKRRKMGIFRRLIPCADQNKCVLGTAHRTKNQTDSAFIELCLH